MLKVASFRRTALRYTDSICIPELLTCRNLNTSALLPSDKQHKSPGKHRHAFNASKLKQTGNDKQQNKSWYFLPTVRRLLFREDKQQVRKQEHNTDQIGNQKYEQTFADTLNAFSSTSDSVGGKQSVVMTDADNLSNTNSQYIETLADALDAFSDNSASLHTTESLTEEGESTVNTKTNEMHTDDAVYEQLFKTSLDAFNDNSDISTTAGLLKENSLAVGDFELKKSLHTITQATQFSITVKTFQPSKQNKYKMSLKGSFGWIKQTKQTSTILEGKESTKCGRSFPKFKKHRSSPDTVLQKLLTKEEEKVLRQLIKVEVRKQLKVHLVVTIKETEKEKYSKQNTTHDTLPEEKIEKVSQEILENLMAQVLKNAIITHKLNQMIDWIKKKENQKKVWKNLMWLTTLIFRIKFIVVHLLPEPIDVLSSADMFSSYTMDEDFKAVIKTSSLVDLGKLFDGKSVSVTSTTTCTVAPNDETKDV